MGKQKIRQIEYSLPEYLVKVDKNIPYTAAAAAAEGEDGAFVCASSGKGQFSPASK